MARDPVISRRLDIPSSNLITRDILQSFTSAASKVPPGELVKDEQFSLFDAVGALEIGDAKMDSGTLEFGESLDDEYEISKLLSAEELLWLMDELMARQVAWLLGYPLSQTVFTSVYVDRLLWPDPSKLSDVSFLKHDVDRPDLQLLRGFCIALLKSCDLVLSMVTSQHYYEEEDFTTQLFNRQLLTRFPVKEVLNAVLYDIEKINELTTDANIRLALHDRLAFQSRILTILDGHAIFQKPSITQIEDAQSAIATIKLTSDLGCSIPGAFNAKIQRKLASTVPPRPMVAVDLDKTWSFWQQLLCDTTNIFETCATNHSLDLLTAFALFGSQQPPLSTYARALLQSILSMDGLVTNRLSIEKFMEEDLKSLTLAGSPLVGPVFPSDIDLQQARGDLEKFISRIAPAFLNVYRMYCLNRCRTRRTLCHAAAEWNQIQMEAEIQDEILQNLIREQPSPYPTSEQMAHSYSLSSWVYHHKLIQLRNLVSLGFELSVYAPHEFAQMYWYLAHICDAHMLHLERIGHFIVQRERKFTSSQDGRKADCKLALDRLLRHFGWLKGTHALAIALHGLYLVLQRKGHFTVPNPAYASNALRYEIRMRPFLGMCIPEPLSYEDLTREAAKLEVNNEKILSDSSLSSGLAKKTWEEILKSGWHEYQIRLVENKSATPSIDSAWSIDIRGALSSSIATKLVLVSLQQKLTSESFSDNGMVVEIPVSGERDFRHPWWIVPRIKFM